MKILFDQGVPIPLRKHLENHEIRVAYEMGWSNLSNGKLLEAAEKDDFELLITTDQNLRYQQNLSTRKITVIVLLTTSWPRIQKKISTIQTIIDSATRSDYTEIAI